MTILALIHNIYASITRSKEWSRVRKDFLSKNSFCSACGSIQKLEVHHIEPFHVNPSKELDENNLITLCKNCHLVFGHLMDYKSWNINVIEDSKVYLDKVKNRPYKIKKMKYDSISITNRINNAILWMFTSISRK
jgi:predicted restriction endonuclease